MPSRYYTTVSCPVCGSRFQTPVEQILDVRVDPEARGRILSGSVNMAVCSSCGAGGALNIPFIYHDPEKEIALLYLPVGVGNTEVQRQQAAGTLTRQLMNALPPEERKGYLLQPETFISSETLVKRVLELEGITEEDMDRNRQQQEFFAQLLQAEEEQWSELTAQNRELLDEGLFSLLQYTLNLAAQSVQAAGAQSSVQQESFERNFAKMQRLYEYMVEETEVGQRLAHRTEVVQGFFDSPSRETLLQALVDAPDDETVTMLVQSGLQLMDYAFFQNLVRRMKEVSPEEKQHLFELRKRVLNLRDEVMQAGQEIAMARAELLTKMMVSEDAMRMARSHLSELDDTFMYVLRSELATAQKEENEEAIEGLQGIVSIINQIMEESMPPELVFVRRLLMTPSEEALSEMLQQNREVLQPTFFQFLEALEANSRENNEVETAEQLAKIRSKAQMYAPASAAPAAESKVQPKISSKPVPSAASETTTPSGLIIAKR
ncbi:MAG: hypothetical protein JXA33_00440 [Anaerolineae bacterium]|nr:hypothetical protein [Anaerolineae bacterium]